MMITKKAIPRRTVLRGLGASLALPLLDGMVPALEAVRNTAANPVRRLGIVYVPNGIMMDHWTPTTEGTGFDLPTILQPLESFRDSLQVLSGMYGVDGEGPHARAATRFLTGVTANPDNGSNLRAGVSMDQIAGRVLGRETQLATLGSPLMDGISPVPVTMVSAVRTRTRSPGRTRRPRFRWKTTPGPCSSASLAIAEVRTRPSGRHD